MISILLISVALAMDCFAVSVVCGVITRRKDYGLMLRLALLFGFFQGFMPLVGWLLTFTLRSYIEAVDHWIAFGMLAFIGGKMIADSFKPEEDEHAINPEGLRTRLLLAIATSIDALAVGISFACTGYDSFRSILLPIIIIGIVSFILSVIGFRIGVRSGDAIIKLIHPELLGGVILIAIGIKVLIEHLG